MRKTTLTLTALTLLGGLALGSGTASAAVPAGVHTGAPPTAYTAMMSRKKMMMRKKMMQRKMMQRRMMKKKMM